MKQIIFGSFNYDTLDDGTYLALFGSLPDGHTSHWPINCTPWSVPGTFRNLKVVNDPNGTWTLYRRAAGSTGTGTGTATAITCSGSGTDITHSVTLSQADIDAGVVLWYKRTGTSKDYRTGYPPSASIEFETADNYSSCYGNAAAFLYGTIGASSRGAVFGGDGGYSVPSVTYGNFPSVCSVAGTVTRLSAFIYADGTADLATGWKYTLVKNGVVQNGGGGTVDTRTTILETADDTLACTYKEFSVHVNVGDVLEMQLENVGTVPFSSRTSAGIKFVADIPGYFVVSGTTNDTTNSSITPTYLAVSGNTGRLGENVAADGTSTGYGATTAGPITSITLTGLVVVNMAPSLGFTATVSLRVNAADPSNKPTVTVTPTDVVVIDTDSTHRVVITASDFWDTKRAFTGAQTLQAHWSYAASVVVQTSVYSGIYYIHPAKTNDTVYTSIIFSTGIPPVTVTADVKIPDPYYTL